MTAGMVATGTAEHAVSGIPGDVSSSSEARSPNAAEFANHGVTSAMVLVRDRHGSCNPNEAMGIADFLLGSEALHHALAEGPP